MPMKAGRPCNQCHRLRPCPDHPDRKPWQRTTPRRQPGGSGWAWQRIRLAILQRDGGLCRLRLDGCTTRAEVIDHRVNIANGGSDDPSNLQSACKRCHNKKTGQESAAGRTR